MSNKFKIIAGVLLIAIAMLIYLESGEKEEVNWFPSYAKKDKIPLGTFALYELLKESRSDQPFTDINQPPYLLLSDSSDIKGTYVFINDYVGFDDNEAESLLEWVSKGNTLFIASREVSSKLRDTLNLETEIYYDFGNLDRKPLVQLVNPILNTDTPFYIDRDIPSTRFSEVDTLETITLGAYDLSNGIDTLKINQPKVHFIKQTFGEGEVIIHLMPEVFTNYFLLRKDNYTYTQNTLSYLPKNQPLLWDNYYKNGKTQSTSPLAVLFKNRYLKYAYYILVFGVLLWVVFEGRRKQRAVPVIKPLPNQTLTFTKTIAGMYLDKRDHTSIAKHQINHLLEYVRSTYNIPTQNTNEDFIVKLAAKSNNSIEDTRKMVNFITYVRSNSTVTQAQVMALNKMIEDFKN